MLGIGGKSKEMVKHDLGGKNSFILPTLAQNTQQQGAGAEQNIQVLLVLLYDADHLLHQLCGPWQACGVHSTGEVQEDLGCVTQMWYPEAAGSPLVNPEDPGG